MGSCFVRPFILQTKKYTLNLKKIFSSEIRTHTQNFIQAKFYSSSMIAFNRTALEEVLKKRFFYAPSFQAYGGKVIFTIINKIVKVWEFKFYYRTISITDILHFITINSFFFLFKFHKALLVFMTMVLQAAHSKLISLIYGESILYWKKKCLKWM